MEILTCLLHLAVIYFFCGFYTTSFCCQRKKESLSEKEKTDSKRSKKTKSSHSDPNVRRRSSSRSHHSRRKSRSRRSHPKHSHRERHRSNQRTVRSSESLPLPSGSNERLEVRRDPTIVPKKIELDEKQVEIFIQQTKSEKKLFQREKGSMVCFNEIEVKPSDELEFKRLPSDRVKTLTVDKNISITTDNVEPVNPADTKPVTVQNLMPGKIKYFTPEKEMKIDEIQKYFRGGNVVLKKAAATPIIRYQKKTKDGKLPPTATMTAIELNTVEAQANPGQQQKKNIQQLLNEAAKKQTDDKQPISFKTIGE